MRFLADGPNIPDKLLEERDKGNVVFFCGAGVSMPAGLPGFVELADRVMRELGTSAEAKSRVLFEESKGANLDQVFNRLQQEYERHEVDNIVSQILKTPRQANVEAHDIVLRLSRNAMKEPRVVTTNFDLLFERANRSLKVHVSPALPDIASVGSFGGIVYLHGRRTQRPSSATVNQRLVLSSSDFGRAYLADGWATRFVRDLLQTYVIVLVGYRASDPPVRYLLEGLHSRGDNRTANIYAFDHGAQDDVLDRWRSLGVVAIPYQKHPVSAHSALWTSLGAWASRADDPEAWRRSIVELSLTNPRQLQPHQRGQVAALVRTTEGAALFASATPPPPAEWLCVFDRLVRYAEPKSAFGNDDPDPLSQYGLDDDPPRPDEPDARRTSGGAIADDLITLSFRDERMDRHKRLAGISPRALDALPGRLAQLAHWYMRVASEPTAIWWAAGYDTLHPQLLAGIRRLLQRPEPELTDFGYRAWLVLLDRFQHSPERRHEWYDLEPLLKREGWTATSLRHFERVVQPYLTAKRHSQNRLYPPVVETTDPLVQDVVEFELQFPGDGRDQLDVPSAILPDVFETLRRALHHGANLLTQTGRRYWQTASFASSEEPGERYLDDASKYFHWVRSLFDRLAIEHPDLARDEVRRWPADDIYFFNKLKIYAWMIPALIAGDDVGTGILSLSEDGFWEEHHRRELLHTLRSRWADLSRQTQQRIEARIITGSRQWSREEDDDYRSRVSRTAATMLGWLKLHGCDVSDETSDLLPALRETVPDWRPSWDAAADHSFDGRVGWVATDSEPSELLDVPIADVVPLAEQKTRERDRDFVRHAPFDGLVAQHPRRALASLSIKARLGEHPPHFWRVLLTRWPQGSTDRLLKVCAGRLTRLPDAVLASCRHDVTRWFSDNAARLGRISPICAFGLYDRILESLSSSGPEASSSALGDVTIGGKVQVRSRRTYDHAINSPTGHLARALVNILDDRKLPAGSKLPSEIKRRIEQLLQLPGDGADLALCEITIQLRWLYTIDPDWVRVRLVPLFQPTHALAEPAWNGLLHDQQLAGPGLFALLKHSFLMAFESASTWHWGDHSAFNSLVERLVVACSWRQKDKRYVSLDEARIALRLVDDRSRAHALWFLATAFSDSWDSFGKAFIQKAWPRESRFRTPASSQQFAFLAEQSGDRFPDVVHTVLHLLVPVEQLEMTLHRAVRGNDQSSLAARFPDAMLQLLSQLVPSEPPYAPYGLAEALEAIASALPNARDDLRWKRLSIVASNG